MSERTGNYDDVPIRKGLMREVSGSNLPNLDYRTLHFAHLKHIKEARQQPMGRFENLAIYLKERTGKDQDVAELDRRMRTFFEDMISRMLKSPSEFDKDVTFNGKELMNFLSGMQSSEEAGG